jgi:hypothetical protein
MEEVNQFNGSLDFSRRFVVLQRSKAQQPPPRLIQPLLFTVAAATKDFSWDCQRWQVRRPTKSRLSHTVADEIYGTSFCSHITRFLSRAP